MGKRTDIKAQIDQLTKEYNAADDDDDLELTIERDGYKATVRGGHARKALKKLGLDDEDQGDGDQGDGDQGDGDQGDPAGDKGDGDKGDPAPKTGHRYFK